MKHRLWFSAHLLQEALRWLLIIEVQSGVQDFSGSRHTQPPGMCLLQSLTRGCCAGNARPRARGAAAAQLLTLEAPLLQTKRLQLQQRGGSACDRESLRAGFHPCLNKPVTRDNSSAA